MEAWIGEFRITDAGAHDSAAQAELPHAVFELLHGEFPDDPEAFTSVLTFTTEDASTRLEMRTVFPSQEMRDEVVEKYHAIEGGQQTLANLAAYVAGTQQRQEDR